MNRFLIIVLLALVIVIAGCTSVKSGEGVVMNLQADPPSVFAKSRTLLHMDVDNRQDKSVYNVLVEIFDTGTLRANQPCIASIPRLLSYEFQTYACWLDAPEIQEAYTSTEVYARTSFDSEFSASQVFPIMSEQEYERRSYASYPRSYSYRDRNVQVDIEFSDQLPLVMRQGKTYYAYLTISNVGNGFVSDIRPGDLTVSAMTPRTARMLNCPSIASGILYPNGNTFPRVVCEIVSMPLTAGENAEFIVSLKYHYETRDNIKIDIVR